MRESKPYTLHVRMTKTQEDRLRELAEAQEVSMSDIVRELIETRLEVVTV